MYPWATHALLLMWQLKDYILENTPSATIFNEPYEKTKRKSEVADCIINM